MSKLDYQKLSSQIAELNLPDGSVSYRLALDRAYGDTLFNPPAEEEPLTLGPPPQTPACMVLGTYRVEVYDQNGNVLDQDEPATVTFGRLPPPAPVAAKPPEEEPPFDSEKFLKTRQVANQVELREEGLLSYKLYHEYFREMMTALRDLRGAIMEMAKDDWTGRAERQRSHLEFEGKTLEILKKRLEELGEGKAAYTEIATALIGAVQTIWVASVQKPRRKKKTAGSAAGSSTGAQGQSQEVIDAEFSDPDQAAQQALDELVSLVNPAKFQKVMKDPAERERFAKRLEGIRKGASPFSLKKEPT